MFGDEGLQQILSFYDGCYIEMLENILPFLTQVVAPAVQADAAQRNNELRKITAFPKPEVEALTCSPSTRGPYLVTADIV